LGFIDSTAALLSSGSGGFATFEVIFKVKRSYFKVKHPTSANFCPFLSVNDLRGAREIQEFVRTMLSTVPFSTASELVSLAFVTVIYAHKRAILSKIWTFDLEI